MRAKLRELYWILVDVFISIVFIPVEYFKELFNLKSDSK
jgi:hypothetical protein